MLHHDSDWWDPADLLFATLPVGAHPAVVVEVCEKSLKVACVTSDNYPHLGEDNFIHLPKGEGGINHDSYIGCLEIFELSFDSLESDEKAFYIGAIEDETFNSITERMQDNGIL